MTRSRNNPFALLLSMFHPRGRSKRTKNHTKAPRIIPIFDLLNEFHCLKLSIIERKFNIRISSLHIEEWTPLDSERAGENCYYNLNWMGQGVGVEISPVRSRGTVPHFGASTVCVILLRRDWRNETKSSHHPALSIFHLRKVQPSNYPTN